MNLNVNLILENVIKIKIGITINADVSANIIKRTSYTWNLSKYICENGNYLISITDNSAAVCNETIEETKIIPPEKIFQQILTRKR